MCKRPSYNTAAVGIDYPTDEFEVLPRVPMENAQQTLPSLKLDDEQLAEDLTAFHWLMEPGPSEELVRILTIYRPGSLLKDKSEHYWVRRASM